MFSRAIIIFVITFLGIIFTRLPKVNVDRPSAAFFGAVANLIVIEVAKTHGVEIKFRQFMKAGLIVTLITMLLSVLVLYVQFKNGL